MRRCRYSWLGRMAYLEAWTLQKALARVRGAEAIEDVLVLLEHPPVYTLGRRGSEDHLLVPKEVLAREGVEVVRVDRGGDITYHGPGQLVGYPIVSLKESSGGAGRYLRNLEEVLILALDALGIEAGRQERLTGVWVGSNKIGAIGVKIDAKRVTCHGFALNVNTDLHHFDRIIPCGIQGKGVTSMERLLGRRMDFQDVVQAVVRAFGAVFGRTMLEVSPKWLHQMTAG